MAQGGDASFIFLFIVKKGTQVKLVPGQPFYKASYKRGWVGSKIKFQKKGGGLGIREREKFVINLYKEDAY